MIDIKDINSLREELEEAIIKNKPYHIRRKLSVEIAKRELKEDLKR